MTESWSPPQSRATSEAGDLHSGAQNIPDFTVENSGFQIAAQQSDSSNPNPPLSQVILIREYKYFSA